MTLFQCEGRMPVGPSAECPEYAGGLEDNPHFLAAPESSSFSGSEIQVPAWMGTMHDPPNCDEERSFPLKAGQLLLLLCG